MISNDQGWVGENLFFFYGNYISTNLTTRYWLFGDYNMENGYFYTTFSCLLIYLLAEGIT